MDKRINAAAAAFPKLEPLIQGLIDRSFPAEVTCRDEEVFYDVATGDIYIALAFESHLNEVVTEKPLIVRVPSVRGDPEYIDSATLIELDLEDITHQIPDAVMQVLKNEYINIKLSAALETSSLMLHKTCSAAFNLPRA